jgi:hypothetical protein
MVKLRGHTEGKAFARPHLSNQKGKRLIVETGISPIQSPGGHCTGPDRRRQFLPNITHPPQMAH